MNALSIGLGALILFGLLFNPAGTLFTYDAVAFFISGVALISVGVTSIKKKKPQIIYYLALIALFSYFVVIYSRFTYTSQEAWWLPLIFDAWFIFHIVYIIVKKKPNNTP